MKCVNCKKNTLIEQDGEQFSWCIKKNDNFDIYENRYCCYFEKSTNSDRIRSMSDKELADWLNYYAHNGYINPNCGWFEWLKQTAEED